MKFKLFTSVVIVSILFITPTIKAQSTIQDSIQTLKEKIEAVEYDLNIIKSNRQNYQIEKNLLKEAYSSNLERINIVVTIVLGLFGILGFLGIRDINNIKQKYETELEKLRSIKTEFESKSKEFNDQKEKFNNEIKTLIEENENQSRRIKLIELKEKITTHLDKGSLYRALEYCNAALEFDPEDTEVLMNKGRILCRQNELEGSINSFKKFLEIEPDNPIGVTNLAEAYLFNNQIEETNNIVSNHKELFQKKKKDNLLEVFKAIEYYHNKDVEKLLQIAKNLIDHTNLKTNKRQITGWDFSEALYFIAHQTDSNSKNILQNLLWYIDGQISGETLMQKLGIEIDETKKTEKG